ncbi:hypothetical protein Hanom_Chr11g01014401 [Helianthus anomalus]
MHASESRLGNDITKSYIASHSHEYSGGFTTRSCEGWVRHLRPSILVVGPRDMSDRSI